MQRGLKMLSVAVQVQETPRAKTVRFRERLDAVPGQFVMVWVPGVDEFPMSLSYPGDGFGLTYQIVGEGTRALASLRTGEKVGIRGPYGRGFSLQCRKALVVAGGAGMACLAPFVEKAVSEGCTVDLVLGAKTSRELLFEERAKETGAKVHVSTDDGSKGFRGLATGLVKSLTSKERFEAMYACGPERMLAPLIQIALRQGVSLQASLERHMRCGIGVCDSCALDGKHVCTDGPVFEIHDLVAFGDLGRHKRDASGRRVPI